MNYDCPVCGEELNVSDFQIQTDCPEYQTSLLFESDAEFIDGMWRDRSRFFVNSQNANKGVQS